MSRARRLARLEAGPAGEGTQAAWAARVGWPQLYSWDRMLAARATEKLLGIGSDPTPPESDLERRYHQDMLRQFPPEQGRGELLSRLLEVRP